MRSLPLLFALLTGVAWAGTTSAMDGLFAQYQASGATAFDAARGKALWTNTTPAPDGGPARSCTTCHGPTLGSAGKHATTGEPIDPMNAATRYADPLKIEKWFGRNCRWTLGRDCTAQEKGDLLTYLGTGGL